MNRRLTFRQTGGKRYRGITQFWELDKVIDHLAYDATKTYLTRDLGRGIHFTQPRKNEFTLWKRAKSNPNTKTALFHFDADSWQKYIKTVYKERRL